MRILDALGRIKTISSLGSALLSVFGRTGAVTAQAGDYTANQITNVPAGTIAATNVQAAINEISTELDAATAHLGHRTDIQNDVRYLRLDANTLWNMDDGSPVMVQVGETMEQVLT